MVFFVVDMEYWSGKQDNTLYGLENLLNCESHREMLARVLELMCDGRLGKAETMVEYIKKSSEINI